MGLCMRGILFTHPWSPWNIDGVHRGALEVAVVVYPVQKHTFLG